MSKVQAPELKKVHSEILFHIRWLECSFRRGEMGYWSKKWSSHRRWLSASGGRH